MIKYLQLQSQLVLATYPGQTVLNVQFEPSAVKDWCLALCMLKEDLIEKLRVDGSGAKATLDVRILNEAKAHSKSLAAFEGETTRLSLSRRDIDYLIHFFLKYCRDGFGEVDHIDLEVTSGVGDASITFKVAEAVQPLSAEEAKKRLGLI